MKIAIDGMGGDYAPEEIVKGAVIAAREYGCRNHARRTSREA